MNDVLAAVYLICFAAIAGGAFALMSQGYRRPDRQKPSQSRGEGNRVHPEAPQPGDELLYVDFTRERLEQMYQESP